MDSDKSKTTLFLNAWFFHYAILSRKHHCEFEVSMIHQHKQKLIDRLRIYASK